MMFNIKKMISMFLAAALFLSGCGGSSGEHSEGFPEDIYTEKHTIENASNESMAPTAGVPVISTLQLPEASGEVIYGGNAESMGITIDASHTEYGYIMVRYDGTSELKKKVILQGPSGIKYTYDLNKSGEYESFVLSDGDGKYNIGIYENIEGSKYSVLFTQVFDVKFLDQFAPFLSSNQYVCFTMESNAVQKAIELSEGLYDELEIVQAVYKYVIDNIIYDKEEAINVQSGYLPDVDEVLSTKKGICFDYAALMTSMLRSQNIPTKLVVGYTGSAYHAWISTYTMETGWVEGVIFFDGTTWKLMDPTFASSGGSSDEIMKYIGDGQNYNEKYLY